MITKIWVRNGYRNINPDKPPRESRELDSFTFTNGVGKPFIKLNGKGWYKFDLNEKDQIKALLFVTRTLSSLTLKGWLEVALNNKFSGNLA